MTSIDPSPDPTELEDPPPSPAADPGPSPRGSRFVRTTAIVAVVGVVTALVGLWVATRPVTTPLQDCGAASAFLLDGRVNQFADPADPPTGLTRAQVLDNNDRPCQERAADQAAPGAVLIVVGTAVGLGAGLVEALARWRWRRQDRRAAAPDLAA